MTMIDATSLKPLVAEVERARLAWERAVSDPSARPGEGMADMQAALCVLAGAVAGLIEAAERGAGLSRIH